MSLRNTDSSRTEMLRRRITPPRQGWLGMPMTRTIMEIRFESVTFFNQWVFQVSKQDDLRPIFCQSAMLESDNGRGEAGCGGKLFRQIRSRNCVWLVGRRFSACPPIPLSRDRCGRQRVRAAAFSPDNPYSRQRSPGDVAIGQHFMLPFGIIVITHVVGFRGQSLSKTNSLTNRCGRDRPSRITCWADVPQRCHERFPATNAADLGSRSARVG